MELSNWEKKLTIWALIGYKEQPWGEDHHEDLETLVDKFSDELEKKRGMKKLTILDTFSGIGGFSYAAERLVGGFETTQFVDNNP